MATVLLTGCASGLGRHLAGVFLSRDDRVVATDLDFTTLQQVAAEDGWAGDRCALLPLDVTSPEAWDDALAATRERFGPRLDIVVNNAGHLEPAWVREMTPAQIERHLAVNVRGVMLGTRAAVRAMLEPAQGSEGDAPAPGSATGVSPGDRGHIINIASLAGIAAVPGLALYSASKFAVRGFTLAAAEELAPQGIAVTAVCPDAIHTPMLDLQVDYEETALTFSASRVLSVRDIERVLVRKVLPRRPVEVMVPGSRGWTAKVASAFPRLARPIVRRLWKVGDQRRRQWQGE